MIHVYSLNVRNKPAAIALAAGALAAGALVIAFGILLLLGLAAVGTLVSAAALAHRALARIGTRRAASFDSPLDPKLEVLPRQSPDENPRALR